jgi:hypothetical protein
MKDARLKALSHKKEEGKEGEEEGRGGVGGLVEGLVSAGARTCTQKNYE